MSDVFVSHIAEDAEVALQIALGLEREGFTTWCYEVDSVPGPSYLVQTGAAINRAKVVVLVISPKALESRQVRVELIRAHESDKEFIPVLHKITHIEFQNRQPEWREALGAATSLRIPPDGIAGVLPRVVEGMRALGIAPGRPSAERLAAIGAALDDVQAGSVPIPSEREDLQPITAETPSPSGKTGAPTAARGVRLSVRLAVMMVLLATITAGLLYSWYEQRSPGNGKPAATARPATDAVPLAAADGPVTVGVMEIRGRGDVPAWMRDFTRDAFNTVLSKIGGVRVYAKEKIDFVREKRNLSEIEAAEALGISKMISGTIKLTNGSVTLEVRATDIRTGLLEDSEQVSGREDQLIELQNTVCVALIEGLKVHVEPAVVKTIFAQRTNDTLESYKLLTNSLFGDEETKPKEPDRPQHGAFRIFEGVAWAAEGGAEEVAVRDILEKYRAALESKDLDRLATIQVSMTENQRQSLLRYFDNAGSLRVQFTDLDILIEGQEALATFTRSDVFKDTQSGREIRLEVRVSSELTKQGDAWKIRGLKKPS